MRGAESSSHFFFFNDTATTEIYTLSLHDALPISFRHHEAVAVLRERLWHRLRRIVLRREGGEQRKPDEAFGIDGAVGGDAQRRIGVAAADRFEAKLDRARSRRAGSGERDRRALRAGLRRQRLA